MIIEIHLETKIPDRYINGVGVFHHWWLHIKYAYSVMMVKIYDLIAQPFDETGQNKLFFTSDTHFFHANIIKYANRPFGSVE